MRLVGHETCVGEKRKAYRVYLYQGHFAVIYKLNIIKFHLIRFQLCEVEISYMKKYYFTGMYLNMFLYVFVMSDDGFSLKPKRVASNKTDVN